MYRTISNAIVIVLLYPVSIFCLFENYKAEQAYKAGDYAQSSAILADQLAAKKDAKTAFNLGVSQYREVKACPAEPEGQRREKLKQTAELFEAVSQDPKLAPAAKFNQANALAHQGEYEKALKTLEELRKESPSEAVEHNYEIVKKLLEQKKKEEEKKKKEDEKKDKQDKQDKQEQDKEKKQKKEKKDKGEKNKKKPEEGQDEPGDKTGEQEKKKQPQKKPGAEEKLPQDLQQMMKAAESEDKKQTKQLLKSQLGKQPSPSGQKNW